MVLIMRRAVWVLAALLAIAAACGSDEDDAPSETADSDSGTDDGPARPDQLTFGGDRPVRLVVPAGYDHAVPTPLVVLLHGFGSNALIQTAYLGYRDVADDRGVLFVAPEGTTNGDGAQFWNATDACCDFEGSGVDDVGYLRSLIDDISGVWNVDPDRVFVIGHSNGGYMSYRLACDVEQVAAIVSLAGATWLDAGSCAPTTPTSVLQIHGDADELVDYAGTNFYPGAQATVQQWATFNECGDVTESDDRVDIVGNLTGEETRVDRAASCPTGLAAELWTIEGGSHSPALSASFEELTMEWLLDHPRVR